MGNKKIGANWGNNGPSGKSHHGDDGIVGFGAEEVPGSEKGRRDDSFCKRLFTE